MGMARVSSCCALLLLFATAVFAADFELTGYELVSAVRTGRTTFEYTYHATLKNSSTTDITSATATLTSLISSVSVVDGEVTFPETAMGTTSKSIDTFKIRSDRTVQFNQSYLPWTITTKGGAVSTPVPAKTNFADALITGSVADAKRYIGDNFNKRFGEIVTTLNAEQLKELGQTVKDSRLTFSSDTFAEFEAIIKFDERTSYLGKFQMKRFEDGWKFFNL
jgi:hypothetical protein